MASITARPSSKWDLERFIQTDPALSTADRYTAHKLLKQLDDKFRPLDHKLAAQGLIGRWIGCARETVNRSYRKLRTLGYFRMRWVTVNRKTAQGIKGVTRVQVILGPVLRRLVDTGRTDGNVSAAQARGVTSHHPSQPLPGDPGAVGSEVVANSADRKPHGPVDNAESKRKTLTEWPRLAGAKPRDVTQLRSHLPIGLITDPAAYAAYIDHLDDEAGEEELSDEHAALAHARAVAAAQAAAATRERELLTRRQPRNLPRSRRK